MTLAAIDAAKSTSREWSLAIDALPHGGYIVRQSPSIPNQEGVRFNAGVFLYASLDLKDCFKFIEKQIYRPENR